MNTNKQDKQNQQNKQSIDANDLYKKKGKLGLAKQLNEQLLCQVVDTTQHKVAKNALNEVKAFIEKFNIKGEYVDNYFIFTSEELTGYCYNLNTFRLEYHSDDNKTQNTISISRIIIYAGRISNIDGSYLHKVYFLKDDKFIECLIPTSTPRDKLLTELYARGLEVHYDNKIKNYCINFILRSNNVPHREETGKKITNSGFVDECTYFYPNLSNYPEFIGANKDKYYHIRTNTKDNYRTIMGSLADWQKNIASYCVSNPIYEFALCVSMAGIFLRDLHWKNSFGFHIYSQEFAIGKSLACKIAASSIGNVAYGVHQWNQTANNLDLIFARSNNSFLALNEIKQLRKSFTLSEIIMKLGNNKGAGRMAKDTESSREGLEWSLCYLSTGNKTTEQVILEREGGGANRCRGNEVI